MNFEEAERKFRELRARIESGEPISRTTIEELVSQLTVTHQGVSWEIHPRTGKWMYFDGAQWVEGTPPSRTGQVEWRPTTPPPPPPEFAPPPKSMPEPASSRARARRKVLATAPDGAPIAPPQMFRMSQLEPLRNWLPVLIGGIVVIVIILGMIIATQLNRGTVKTTPTAAPTQVVYVVATAAPSPSPVAAPTSVLPTATPAPVRAKTNEALVNVRAAPNTNAEVVVRLQKDVALTLLGRTADGQWYQINVTGRSAPAWVFGETITVTAGDAKTLPVVNPNP